MPSEPSQHEQLVGRASLGSPASFIDLSDEEDVADISSIISGHRKRRRRDTAFSLSSPSLLENLTPEEQAEEDRRRKRDKLARLHRFLGSRVPEELVLGIDKSDSLSLPPDAPENRTSSSPKDAETRKSWLKLRRSNSVTDIHDNWTDHHRLREDLDDKEKAVNVRRAHKMEKVCVYVVGVKLIPLLMSFRFLVYLHHRICIILVIHLLLHRQPGCPI